MSLKFSLVKKIICFGAGVLPALFAPAPVYGDIVSHVTATMETPPVPHAGDAADDVAIWVHPTDTSLSTIIGTDKLGGILVYDLSGKQLQYRPDGMINNVDIRYNFSLGGVKKTLVSASNRSNNSISVWVMNNSTRMLEPAAARTITTGFNVYGYCMYHSASSGKYYGLVNDKNGVVKQFEFFESAGKVDAKLVRTFDVGLQVEGCVADDELGHLYIGEEAVAIWKYGAEPASGTARVKVDSVGSHVVADIEGMSIYYAANGRGYLIVSSQGNARYVVYDRSGANSYVSTFDIVAGAIDGVTGTDSLEVMSFGLGSQFPKGVFVVQDGTNTGANQNFKAVPWEKIAMAGTPLLIDTSMDPRKIGASAPAPSPSPAPAPAPSPAPAPTPPPGGTLTFAAIADSQVSYNNPSVNYGAKTELDADSSPLVQSYLKFDVSGLTGTILSAKLRVYVTDATANGPKVVRSGTGWTESGLTYSNRPALIGSTLDDKGAVAAGAYTEFDVKLAITANGIYSFALLGTYSDGMSFYSREGAQKPQLVITLSSP